MKEIKKKNVITIKWGNKYNYNDINKLYNQVKRNTTYDVNFYCFTDDAERLDKNIIAFDLPKMNMLKKDLKYAYQKEAGLCDDNLGNLNGQRVLFLDTDSIITGNIDCFFDYQNDDEFIIINDWNSKGDKVGQASCYSWKVGTLGYIKEYFEKNAQSVIKKFYTASQEYLSTKVIEKYGKLNFWPKTWCVSFKYHCLPKWYLRWFVQSKLPKDAKILTFHGDPKIENAIIGKWSDNKIPFYKKIYKKNLPAKWIEKYFY